MKLIFNLKLLRSLRRIKSIDIEKDCEGCVEEPSKMCKIFGMQIVSCDINAFHEDQLYFMKNVLFIFQQNVVTVWVPWELEWHRITSGTRISRVESIWQRPSCRCFAAGQSDSRNCIWKGESCFSHIKLLLYLKMEMLRSWNWKLFQSNSNVWCYRMPLRIAWMSRGIIFKIMTFDD